MAAATYFATVQKIYIAFYQRPADPAGLQYWAQRIDVAGGDASAVVAAFATSPEAVALYGTIDATTIGSVIDAIYLAMFNRAPDATGKQFYVDGFAAGTFTAGSIALRVLNGATGDDSVAINNKAQVANDFTQQVDGRLLTDAYFGTGSSFSATYSGDADVIAARTILKTVTFSPATVLSHSQVTAQIQSQIANPGDTIGGQTSGQTFTLTVGSDTGASFTGGSGNDTFVGNNVTAGDTFTVGDTINGGAGTDTLSITQTNAITLPTGATVANVETVNLLSGNSITLNTASGFAGLTALNATSKSGATGTTLTAAATTDIMSTETALQDAATSQLVINGGKNVTVSATGVLANTSAFTATSGAGAEILVGATTAAAGTVTVTNSFKGATTEVSGDVFVKGGTAVTVTQAVTNSTVNETNVQGQVSVVGTAITTAVTVNQDKTVAASATGLGLVGKTAGAVTVTDVNVTSATAAGAIATVSLNNAGAAVVNSGALTTLNLAGSLVTVDASTLGALTTPANTTLALNLTGAVSTGAVTIDTDIKTLNISGNTTASTITSLVSDATKINVSGDAKVTFTGNTTAAVTDIVVTNTGGAAFGTAIGAGVNFTGGAGADSVKLTGNITKAITMGAGNDTVTYSGIVGTGGSVAAGDGTDTIIMTVSDAESTAGASSSSVFNTKFTGFEVLTLSNSGTGTVDMDGINAASQVNLSAAVNAGGLTLNNLASNGTVKITTDASGALTVGVKSAIVGATDVLNLELSKSTGVLAAGSVTAANVETINIKAADAATTGSVAAINTLTLAATSATTVVVTGNNGLTLVNTNNAAITNFDASAVIGNSTLDTAGVAATTDTAANLAVTFASANVTAIANVSIKGGAGDDVLSGSIAKDTISGGAGADRIYSDNAGAKAIATNIIGAAADTNTVGLTVNGIAVTVLLDGTTGASTVTAANALVAAINANTSLKGIAFAEIGATTSTVKVTSLVDGAMTIATANTTATSILLMDGTGVTVVGTAGTTAIDSIDGGAGADVIVGGGGADTLTTGAGADTVFMLKAHSTLATMATITDYTYAIGGASNDKLILGDVVAAIGTVTTVQDLSASATLAAAADAAALANTGVTNGLSVFIWGGNEYAYVESTSANTTYTTGDFMVKLTGLPLAAGATIAGSGFDAV